MQTSYKRTCAEHIIDTFGEYIGQDIEFGDIGYMLSESENADGSWYCSTSEAKADLSHWMMISDDVEDFIEDYKSELGEMPYDGLAQPESFHCLMMIYGVDKLFNSLDCVRYLDGMTTIDQDLIDKVEAELSKYTQ